MPGHAWSWLVMGFLHRVARLFIFVNVWVWVMLGTPQLEVPT